MEIPALRVVPSFLRVLQNLRVGNRSSNISAVRYGVHFVRELLTRNSTEWIVVSIAIGFWEA